MKKNKKHYSQLLLGLLSLFLIGITFGSCEAEKNATHSGKRAFQTQRISFEKFKQETGLTNFDTTINIRENSTTLQGKTVEGKYELTDFDIETDVIKTMEFQQKKTYSLKIHPKDTISENYFNLIVYKKDNVWENLIMEMKRNTDNLYGLQNDLNDNFIGQMKKLYDSSPPIMTACTFVSITYPRCQGCVGTCDQCINCFATVVFNSCDFSGNNPGSSGSFGSSGSSGSSGGPSGNPGDETWISGNVIATPGPDDIVIEPNLDPRSIRDLEQTQNNPCGDLKTNTSDLQFRQKLNTLNKPVNFNKDHETAFIATKNGNVKGFAFLEASSGVNSNQIDIKSVPNTVSYMHVHNNDYTTTDSDGETVPVYTAKIPSGADLINFFWMQFKAIQQGIPITQTYGLAISSEAIYTFKLKVNDYMAMTTALNNNGFNWEVFMDDLDIATRDILKENLPAPEEKAKTEKLLLQKLKESNLDQLVGLYEGTSLGSDLNAGVSWKEKYLDESGSPQEKPCN